MLRSQLSIMGLYQWDSNIFEHFKVPTEMDKDVCVTEILSQCAELELVYPNWDIMHELIKTWTIAELPQWERAYKDMTIEYNPIWNVDGTESETITRELTGDSSNKMTGKGSNTSIDSTKGYNRDSWTETDKSDSNGTQSEDRAGTMSEQESITTTKVRGGNIGVTMTQQMLNADLDLLERLNPYQYIVNSFKRRFCLLVY